jgi:uncharacterized protein Usg
MENKIEYMWQAFRQENDNPTMEEFIRMVSREFECSLQEANEMASHLLLID